MAKSRYIEDAAIRLQVYLERLKAAQAKDADKVLQQLDRAIRRELGALGAGKLNTLQRRSFEKVLSDLSKEIDAITSKFTGNLLVTLKEVNEIALDMETQLLDTATKASVTAAEVTSAAAWQSARVAPVQATGKLLEPFMEGWANSTRDKVVGAVRNGYAQGKTIQQVLNVVRGTKGANYEDGLIGGTVRREMVAMIRTGIQHVAQNARQDLWTENSDVVEKYRWVSTLDSRTTEQCAALDGMEFKVGEGPVPPIHIGCRSTTIPVVSDSLLSEGATRASKGAEGGAQIDGDMTYYEWLKTQPAWFQDDAIGPSRAALLRDGGLSADAFARLSLGRNFEPLTLEEMREKAPQAFRRAGL